MLGRALCAALLGLAAACTDGPIGSIGPGGKANSFEIEGIEFDAVRALALTTTATPSSVQLRLEGEQLDPGARCEVRLRALSVTLDRARLDEGPFPIDLAILHVVRVEDDESGDPVLADQPERAQPPAVSALRWLDPCVDPGPEAEVPAPVQQRFVGDLRIVVLTDDRIEARIDLDVTLTRPGAAPEPPLEIEAFVDLALPRLMSVP